MVVGGIHYVRKFWNAPGVANNRLKIVVGTVVTPLILIGEVGGVALASIPEYDLGEQERIAASSFNDMGADLGRALFEMDSQNKNIVYSPLSIGMAFSMVYAGSEGQARQELEEFLNVDVEPEQFHESNQEILRSLKDPEPQYRYHRMLGMANNIKTNIANGI